MKIWEIPSGNLIVSIVSPAENNDSPKKLPLLDVNFSSDGERLVMATGTPTVLLMDAATRQMTALPSSEVRPIIMTAQFTPDGKQIITTGRDSDVKFWDATSGQEVKSLTVHNKKVNDVTISNDGKWIATASLDGTFHVSPLNTNDLLAFGCGQVNGRRLTDVECKKFLGTDKCPPPPCN